MFIYRRRVKSGRDGLRWFGVSVFDFSLPLRSLLSWLPSVQNHRSERSVAPVESLKCRSKWKWIPFPGSLSAFLPGSVQGIALAKASWMTSSAGMSDVSAGNGADADPSRSGSTSARVRLFARANIGGHVGKPPPRRGDAAAASVSYDGEGATDRLGARFPPR